jgi:hypothetical protein
VPLVFATEIARTSGQKNEALMGVTPGGYPGHGSVLRKGLWYERGDVGTLSVSRVTPPILGLGVTVDGLGTNGLSAQVADRSKPVGNVPLPYTGEPLNPFTCGQHPGFVTGLSDC